MKNKIPTKLVVAPRGYSWHGDKLQKDEDGTPTPQINKPVISIRESEWRALSPEAQAKLMQITGAIHPDELRRRAQAAEDLRQTPLAHNDAGNAPRDGACLG